MQQTTRRIDKELADFCKVPLSRLRLQARRHSIRLATNRVDPAVIHLLAGEFGRSSREISGWLKRKRFGQNDRAASATVGFLKHTDELALRYDLPLDAPEALLWDEHSDREKLAARLSTRVWTIRGRTRQNLVERTKEAMLRQARFFLRRQRAASGGSADAVDESLQFTTKASMFREKSTKSEKDRSANLAQALWYETRELAKDCETIQSFWTKFPGLQFEDFFQVRSYLEEHDDRWLPTLYQCALNDPESAEFLLKRARKHMLLLEALVLARNKPAMKGYAKLVIEGARLLRAAEVASGEEMDEIMAEFFSWPRLLSSNRKFSDNTKHGLEAVGKSFSSKFKHANWDPLDELTFTAMQLRFHVQALRESANAGSVRRIPAVALVKLASLLPQFGTASAEQWWVVARECFLATYPNPSADEAFLKMAFKQPPKLNGDEAFMERLRGRFISLAGRGKD